MMRKQKATLFSLFVFSLFSLFFRIAINSYCATMCKNDCNWSPSILQSIFTSSL